MPTAMTGTVSYSQVIAEEGNLLTTSGKLEDCDLCSCKLEYG